VKKLSSFISKRQMSLDNVCIESLSIDLTRPMLDAATRSVDKLADKIDEQVFHP
jgi:DNA excision repair protein ERCC-2